MSLILAIDQVLRSSGLALRKASPRGLTRMTLELVGLDRSISAGQWFADADEAAHVVALVVARFGDDSAAHLMDGHLVVQRRGADRKLPVVRRLLDREGSVLVAHRAERRAVVRDRAGNFNKVVRPHRVAELVEPLARVHLRTARTPRVLDVDVVHGCVTMQAISGVSLNAWLTDPSRCDEDAVTRFARAGAALHDLHLQPPPALSRRPHTADDELDSARRWADAAVGHGLLDADACAAAYDEAAARILGGSGPTGLVHRDFHDKQVLVDDDGGSGILDLDLACVGEPAVDVANLVAHIELRRLQHLCSASRATACTEAFLDAYADVVDPGRFAAYAATTRLRLAGVYAFRPSRPGLTDALLEPSGITV